jgi:glucuronosyltransferase
MKTNFRAKELGSVLVDQINKPLDRAVWWIEHIMRHPTLYSGRSPVHKLTWYQYYLLDVLAFYSAITFFFGWIIFKIISYCICKTKKTGEKAKKTKNGNLNQNASKKNK